MTETDSSPEAGDHPADIKQVMDIHVAAWMSFSGVEAVGLGDGCIHVYFSDKNAMWAAQIPNRVDGVAIRKMVSGPFEAQDDP